MRRRRTPVVEPPVHSRRAHEDPCVGLVAEERARSARDLVWADGARSDRRGRCPDTSTSTGARREKQATSKAAARSTVGCGCREVPSAAAIDVAPSHVGDLQVLVPPPPDSSVPVPRLPTGPSRPNEPTPHKRPDEPAPDGPRRPTAPPNDAPSLPPHGSTTPERPPPPPPTKPGRQPCAPPPGSVPVPLDPIPDLVHVRHEDASSRGGALVGSITVRERTAAAVAASSAERGRPTLDRPSLTQELGRAVSSPVIPPMPRNRIAVSRASQVPRGTGVDDRSLRAGMAAEGIPKAGNSTATGSHRTAYRTGAVASAEPDLGFAAPCLPPRPINPFDTAVPQTPVNYDCPVRGTAPDRGDRQRDEPAPCVAFSELGLRPARRPTTTMLGNGQIYDFGLGYRGVAVHDHDIRALAPEHGWHSPHLTSYARPYRGVAEIWSLDVLDDDGNFNTRVTENLTQQQLYAMRERYKYGAPSDPENPESPPVEPGRWRPRSITACSLSTMPNVASTGGLSVTSGEFLFSTRFAVSWICDHWETDVTQNDISDWEIFIDQEKTQLEQLIDAWAAEGWRPISISGYAYAYDTTFQGAPPSEERVRYAAVLVKDQVSPDEWQSSYWLELTREELFARLDEEMSQGRLPISISSWRTNNADAWQYPGALLDHEQQGWSTQRWSLLCVQDKSLDGEHSVVDDVLVNWKEVFGYEVIDPNFPSGNMAHRFNVMKTFGWRPVCMAAFTWYNHGQDVLLWEGDVMPHVLVVWRRHPPRYLRVAVDVQAESGYQTGEYIPGDSNDPYASLHDALVDQLEKNRCNASAICLTNDGAIMMSRGYTWAPEGFPTTYPAARFRAASVSKNLVATALMKQWQAGLGLAFGLDDPFFGPGLNPFPIDEGWEFSPDYTVLGEITPRRLLTHNAFWIGSFESIFDESSDAGLSLNRRGDYEIPGIWVKDELLGLERPVSRENFLRFWLSLPDSHEWQMPPTDQTPRWWQEGLGNQSPVGRAGWPTTMGAQSLQLLLDKWRYSNFGYELLYELVRKLSGGDAEAYLSSELLIPLGMHHTEPARTDRSGHFTGEVIGTPTNTSADYLDDLPTSTFNLPADPFGKDGNLARPEIGSGEMAAFADDIESGAPVVTSVYGQSALLGSVVLGSGGYITSAEDLAKLMAGFRGWHDPDEPNWGLMGEFGQMLLLANTVDVMLDLGSGVRVQATDPSAVQVVGWRVYDPEGVPDQLDPAMQLNFYGGGDIAGGSAVALRTKSGTGLGIAFSRLVGSVNQAQLFYSVLSSLGL